MPRQLSLVRQWTLLKTLCARRYGVTVKEIAEEMKVCQKTVRRDLETFRAAGFPMVETAGDFGQKTFRLDADKHRPDISFTFDEAISLYLGRRLLEPLAGTVFWDGSRRAFDKIRASLGKDALKYVERFAVMFHQTTVGISDYSKQAELIDTLMQGIEDRRATFITYRSLRATESVTYDVRPYGLIYHRGSLYLVGHSPDHDAIRHWKVDRIEAASLEELRFDRPEDFDLSSHFAKSFGVFQGNGEVHVKVRFTPTVARYVQESQWHSSQKLTQQKDGSLLAEFDLDGTEEIMRWILSFGKNAVVIEPEELSIEIQDEVASLIKAYSTLHAKSNPATPRTIKE